MQEAIDIVANDEIDSTGEEEDIDEEEEDYATVLEKLKSQWLLTEIHHSVSKTASEEFWRVSLEYFHKLESSRGRKKKTSQFKSIRRHMHHNLIPQIDLEIACKNRTTGQITFVKDTVTPLKRFSPSQYEKLYEIGSVKVKINLILLHFIPDRFFLKKFCTFYNFSKFVKFHSVLFF